MHQLIDGLVPFLWALLLFLGIIPGVYLTAGIYLYVPFP